MSDWRKHELQSKVCPSISAPYTRHKPLKQDEYLFLDSWLLFWMKIQFYIMIYNDMIYVWYIMICLIDFFIV